MDTTVFQTLSTFLKQNSGLCLTPDKGYLLESRLQPIAEMHGCQTVPELAARLKALPSAKMKQDIIEAMTTNETSFFRDGTPFNTFKSHVLPYLQEKRKTKRIRILCAAASSGQEPYSLALMLAEAKISLAGWNIEILGVDLDNKILQRAETAVYSQFEVQRGLPVTMLAKYFEQCPEQTWRLKPEVRGMVKFRQCNLLQPFRELGTFDVIFCRNVLIYFDPPTKTEVLKRLSEQIAEDGFLFLGGAETVVDITDRFIPAPQQRGLYIPRVTASARAAG